MRKVSLTYNRKVINEPGEARVLRFRNIADPGILMDYELEFDGQENEMRDN